MQNATIISDPRVQAAADEQPFPLVFLTISGAHLYGICRFLCAAVDRIQRYNSRNVIGVPDCQVERNQCSQRMTDHKSWPWQVLQQLSHAVSERVQAFVLRSL